MAGDLDMILGLLEMRNALGTGEGAEFRAPMGRAIIGGVITSTLLTLLVIPTIYELMDRGRERLIGLFRRRVPESEAPSTVQS